MPKAYTKLFRNRLKDHFARISEQKYGKAFNQVMEEIGGEEAWIETLHVLTAEYVADCGIAHMRTSWLSENDISQGY